MPKNPKPKIPAPKRSDNDCISFGGLTVCPHTVYLTRAQKKSVDKMHSHNVSKLRKRKGLA
jgi:hypothetical protein